MLKVLDLHQALGRQRIREPYCAPKVYLGLRGRVRHLHRSRFPRRFAQISEFKRVFTLTVGPDKEFRVRVYA